MYVEDLARVEMVWDEDGSRSQPNDSQTTTELPDTDVEDLVSFVSSVPIQFQFEHEDPYPWQHFEQLEPLPPQALVEQTSIVFSEDDLGHVQD